MLGLKDLASRHARVRAMMERQDLDAVIAIDASRDEILLSWQRWLTGFTPLGGPAAAVVYRDGRVELMSQWLGRTVPAFFEASGLSIQTVPSYSPATFCERLGAAKRIGVAEETSFPASIHLALRAMSPAPDIVDVSAEMLQIRLRKSAAELQAVRRSCEIADKVWEHAAEIFRVGRKFYQVLADVDHLIRSEGAESGFLLVGRLPFLGMPMRVLADPEEVVADMRYLLEVSPRFDGYYSQLTGPITTRVNDEALAKAFSAIVKAKEFAQPKMIPGADLSEIAVEVERFLADQGQKLASRSLGHFCGMALEEPRHDPGKPFILEENMTLIFHPVLFSPDLASLMRADTYVITPSGAERLNRFPARIIQSV